jgi:Ca2+-binding EF-hand superfamily protein
MLEEGELENEFKNIFNLFDKKGKGQIGVQDIKQIFDSYLDI